jgi:carbon storage regulator
MLVLKRKQGQAIDVGDDVRITLKEIRGGHVKVVISAPKGVRVQRSEIALEISEANRRAAESCIGPDERFDRIVGRDKRLTDGKAVDAGW